MTTATTSKLPVIFVDGGYRIQFGCSLSAPLRNHGQPVEAFDAGWFPKFAYVGFHPLIALELKHRDGREVTWWLDDTMNGLGDRVAHLDAKMHEVLLDKSAPVMQHIINTSISSVREPMSEHVKAFSDLNENTKGEITQHFLHSSIPSINVRNIAHDEDVIFIGSSGRDVEVFDKKKIGSSLSHDFGSTLIEWLSGPKSWPSIYTDGNYEFCGSMPLDDFRFALKFSDFKENKSFFVLVSHHYSQVIGIFVPSCWSVFCRDSERLALFKSLYGDFERMISSHIISFHKSMGQYFSSGGKKLASLPRLAPQTHLGHQLWNELSGVDMVLRNGRRDDLPEWWIVEADEPVEIYGPLETLYPEMSSRVRRGFKSLYNAVNFAYENDFALLRITDEYVSAGLRKRIGDLVNATAIGADVNRHASERRSGPVVVFGLRTENRTHVEPVDFFVRIAESFQRRFGSGTIVIDGHNGTEDLVATGKVRSHGEHSSARPPIEVECEIVDAVRRCVDGSGVDVVSTIGKSVYRSIAWGNKSDFFIAIWGAGLAKYRWISNLPGAIVSSSHNLSGRPDFDIYFNDKYMEDPKSVLVPPASAIEDDPDAPLLIRVSDQSKASYYNFRERPEVFEKFLDSLWDKVPGWQAEGSAK
jgi:hypothetical protein